MTEHDSASVGTARRYRQTPADSPLQDATLDALIRAKGLERYAYFFTTVEGLELPDDLEEYSGHVIDEQGRVFRFWMGLDSEKGTVALIDWEEEPPQERWMRSGEYRRARQRVGLPD